MFFKRLLKDRGKGKLVYGPRRFFLFIEINWSIVEAILKYYGGGGGLNVISMKSPIGNKYSLMFFQLNRGKNGVKKPVEVLS
jgi:hypothetical protein